MSRRFRLAPALLAFALFSASPVLPQARRGEAPPRPASFAESLRGFLPDFLTRLGGDLGCLFDPAGGACRVSAKPPARPSLTAVRAEAGCGADPYGGCGTLITTVAPPTGH
jgi:hypothetical protein